MNHMLRDWGFSGPDRGVGSKATVRVDAVGRSETVEIEVIAGERPIVRAILRRANRRAMARLAQELAPRDLAEAA
jgi:hypothetical protein